MKKTMNRLAARLYTGAQEAKRKLAETSGQFAMEHTAVFIAIIVIAGICITLLTLYLKDSLAPKLESKVDSLFS